MAGFFLLATPERLFYFPPVRRTFAVTSAHMKKWCLYFVFLFVLAVATSTASAQCSICTKTAQQLGDKPGRGLNAGIIYLAMTPFLVFGFIGYRWWKNNRGN